MSWIRRWLEARAADRANLLAEAHDLLAEGGRTGAIAALDAQAAASVGDPKALRRVNALRLVLSDISPRPARSDTATRMHYR